jgi:hypothetical protein
VGGKPVNLRQNHGMEGLAVDEVIFSPSLIAATSNALERYPIDCRHHALAYFVQQFPSVGGVVFPGVIKACLFLRLVPDSTVSLALKTFALEGQ